MKTLSIRQPWAWFIVNGYKNIENRTWATKHRGELLIHSGKQWGMPKRDIEKFFEAKCIPFPGFDEMKQGGIVGKVNVSDCIKNSNSDWAIADQHHWVLKSPLVLSFMPLLGKLGLFDVDFYGFKEE